MTELRENLHRFPKCKSTEWNSLLQNTSNPLLNPVEYPPTRKKTKEILLLHQRNSLGKTTWNHKFVEFFFNDGIIYTMSAVFLRFLMICPHFFIILFQAKSTTLYQQLKRPPQTHCYFFTLKPIILRTSVWSGGRWSSSPNQTQITTYTADPCPRSSNYKQLCSSKTTLKARRWLRIANQSKRNKSDCFGLRVIIQIYPAESLSLDPLVEFTEL